MTDPTTGPMTRLTVQIHDAQAVAEEYPLLASGLRQELLDLDVGAAEPLAAGPVPAGARGVDLEALGTLVVTIAKSGVLDAVVSVITAWLTSRPQRSVRLEVDGDVLELSGVASGEQRRLTDAWLGRHLAVGPRPAGSRSALIVASYDFADPGLRRLRAPARDAEALAGVLRDPAIGGFEVRVMLNEPAHVVNLAVEEFFADRDPDDLLLVLFSGHGVKGQDGDLYFAAADTQLRRLAATAVPAEFVNRRMSRTRSRRVVLLLDCCYAGAFERGMTARSGGGVDIAAQLGGRGRAVITASSAMEYAFEGDQLTDAHEIEPSVFSSALVEGLATGEADRDQDGMIALDELYDYVYDKVRATTPNQTPSKWTFGVQGDLYIARRSRPVDRPAPLPAELAQALDHPLVGIRVGAVIELDRLLRGRHGGLSLAARQALEHMAEDDSRSVASAAAAALQAGSSAAAHTTTAPTTTPTAPTSTPVRTAPVLADLTAPPEPGTVTRKPAAAPPAAATSKPRPAHTDLSRLGSGPDGVGAGPARDRLSSVAGGLAILSASLMVVGVFTDYQSGESMANTGDSLLWYLPTYALMIALLAAGAGGLMLTRTRQLIGAGTLLGSTAAALWGLGFLTADLTARDDLGAGFWAELVGHLLLLLAAGLAAAMLGRTQVRLAPRPSGLPAWLSVALGLAGAVMLLVHIRILSDAGFVWSGGEYDSLLPWACLAVITPVVATLAVLASPRRFAIALLAGWIGGAFAVVVYGYLYYLTGNYDQPGPLIAFGGTLPALLVASIRNANSATHRPNTA